jgi:hypothetical protein
MFHKEKKKNDRGGRKMKVKLLAFFAVGTLLISGLTYVVSAVENRPQSAVVAAAVSTVATIFLVTLRQYLTSRR